jgi:C4-dicarboxylate-binding protein DctP
MKNKVFFVVIGVICACALLVMPSMSKAQEKVIKMRVIHAYPETTQHGRNMFKFAELVKKYTQGRVEVTLFPSASVAPITKEPSVVLSGGAEAAYSIGGVLEGIDRAEAIWTIPYLIRTAPGDTRHIRKAMLDPRVEGVLQKRQAEKGFHRFGTICTYDGSAFFNNKRPLKTLEDFKGLVFRSPGGMMGDLFLKQLGASSAVIPGTEVPVALQTGVVDGTTTVTLHWHDARWHTKYATTPYWNGYSLPLIASLTWWNKLPNDIKDAFTNKIIPELQEYAYNETDRRTLEVYQIVQKPPYNVEVYTMPKSEQKRLKDATQKVCIEKFREVIGKDLADSMIKAVRETTPPDMLLD